MTGIYWGYPEPLGAPPLINDQHDRTHQHQPFLGLRHHVRPQEYPNSPDVDIRDNGNEYLIEIEVPGIKKSEDVHLQWLDARGFIVTGEVRRPGEAPAEDAKASTTDKTKVRSSNGHKVVERPYTPPEGRSLPHLLAGERRVGFFKRTFMLPVEVDAGKVTAKLEAGLLSLKIPKHDAAIGKGAIHIEVVE